MHLSFMNLFVNRVLLLREYFWSGLATYIERQKRDTQGCWILMLHSKVAHNSAFPFISIWYPTYFMFKCRHKPFVNKLYYNPTHAFLIVSVKTCYEFLTYIINQIWILFKNASFISFIYPPKLQLQCSFFTGKCVNLVF